MLYPVSSGLRPVSSSFPPPAVRRTGQESGLWLPDAQPTSPSCRTWGRVFFILLASILFCSLTLPPMAQAEEKQDKITRRATHAQVEDTGWNVCRDMVKNFDLLQQPNASFACQLRFHPSMTQFSEPDWEELKIEDNWQLLYSILEPTLRGYWDPPIPFAEWQAQFIHDMQAGYREYTTKYDKGIVFREPFHPSLRMTRVRFEQDGPLVAVVSYSPRPLAEREALCEELSRTCPYMPNVWPVERLPAPEGAVTLDECLNAVARKRGYEGMPAAGEYENEFLVLYLPGENKPISSIYTENPRLESCGSRLFLYKGRAYIMGGFGPFPGGQGRGICRAKKPKDPWTKYVCQGICAIDRVVPREP